LPLILRRRHTLAPVPNLGSAGDEFRQFTRARASRGGCGCVQAG